MRVDVMVDIETLGTREDSTIFQIAAIAFDINTGKTLNEFNMVSDIARDESINITGATLKWWLATDKELFTKLLNSGTCTSKQLLKAFKDWIDGLANSKDIYLWGNGILFDNQMIQHQLRANDMKYPIFYRNDRDMRTIVDLASARLGITENELKDMYKDPSLVAHDAYDDVRYQINLVSKCYSLLIGGWSC
jgi:hypothetical protein